MQVTVPVVITAEMKRKALAREVAIRKRNYPRWVEMGRMAQADADREIAVMEAVLADYQPRDMFGRDDR
jgi:hypothetical protein